VVIVVKVSVIVPVYNVEKYLERCLDSLVNQTLGDIEIIVVNDGSPDNSQKIIDKYAKKYKKVKAYKKENGGLSSARNYGIKHANGEYIAFVDSDDYVEVSMFYDLYNKAKSNNFDVVCCDLDYVDDNGKYISDGSSKISKDIYSNKDIKNMMLDFYPAAWNKIYKKDLFNNGIEFKCGVWFEDVEFIYRMIPYINSIGVVREKLYHYVQRDGAITKTFDDRLYHYIDNWNGIVDFYKKRNFYEEYYYELEYCYVRYLYATFIKQATNYTDESKYDDAVRVAISNVKEKFPKYKRNKYFYKNVKGIYLVLFNKIISRILFKLKHK